MRLSQKKKDYLLVYILLFFSGNPIAVLTLGKYATIIALMMVLLIVRPKKLDGKFKFVFYRCVAVLMFIFISQYFTLGYVSWPGAFNFLIKVFIGSFILNYMKDRFLIVFFKVLTTLSLISLICFVGINLLKIPIPPIKVLGEFKSYFIYSTFDSHIGRNMGMFWEPGAFSGILTLCIALNFKNIQSYWNQYRGKLIIISAALITTQSTTGYLVAFLIIVFHLINTKNRLSVLFVLPLLLMVGLYFYDSTDFLKSKIEGQYASANDQNVGEFSNSRFGTIIFDWYYIQKHPITGNGLSEKTRYADHQYLFRGVNGDAIGSGNGFSNFIASMGFVFIVGYFFLLFRTFLPYGKLFAILIFVVVLLNLQGEQWFNYPIYLGLPFLNLTNKRMFTKLSLVK